MNLPDTLFSASSGILFLAQQDAGLPDITTGQTIAGTLVLLTMGLSGLMLGVWYVRYQQLGYTIPTANRGILRVPMPGLAAALVLAFFICLMVTASIFIPVESLPVDGGTTAGAESVAVEQPAESPVATTEIPADRAPEDPQIAPADEATSSNLIDSTEPSSDVQSVTPKPKTPPMSREDLLSMLFQTTIFDLSMFGLFALILITASHRGRVAIPLMLANPFAERRGDTSSGFRGTTPSAMPNQLWPDLDAPTPHVTSVTAEAIAQELETNESEPTATGDPAGGQSSTRPASPDSRDANTDFTPVYPIPAHIPFERFSLVTEFRWACEVFLAAYLPTSLLRFVIISLVIAFTGEQPSSHPFLEMMDKELDPTILGMIVLLAVVMAPIVEELFYRVVILGGLAQYNYVRSGLVLSSVVFCMAHGFPDSLSLLPLAFALGFTYLHRRSYVTVMMVHFLFNAFNMVIAGAAMLK